MNATKTTILLLTQMIVFLDIALFSQNIVINWNELKQTIDGFGASDAWFSDEIMTHPNKNEILDLLFDKEKGAGLSILRHRIPPNESDWSDFQIELVSNDLDFGTRPYNAVRFANITIPRGAVIDKAYIQFTAKDNLAALCDLTIQGEAADSAASFEAISANISGRPQTIASITWQVPAWHNGDRGPNQRTPDIREIIQEIINRNKWRSGNSLVFLIKNLTGKRSALSFEQDRNLAPELTIYFNSTDTISRKIAMSKDDAEENGQSYITYGAKVTREAFARGCQIVWAAAWTPPALWKTNGQPENGGYLKTEHYQDWANRLELYRTEFEKRSGISLYGISPQNEPGLKSWESCQWQNTDFRDFIKNNLGPTLNPSCRIIVPEETNWSNVDNFYIPTHNDPESRKFVDIVAGHVYGGNPDVSYQQFGKPVWETEWSYDTSTDDLSIENGIAWAYNFWRLLVNAEVSACHHWWLVNFNGDGKQQGLIASNPFTDGYEVSKRLWTIGNYSKFVRPGWKRIEAAKNPTTDVFIAAFRDMNSDEFAIVAINKSQANETITFGFDGFTATTITPHQTSESDDLKPLESIPAGKSFSTILPGKTVTTYVGKGLSETSNSLNFSKNGQLIHHFSLEANYPNPFNPITTIQYSLLSQAEILLQVYDSAGRNIRTLISQLQPAGNYSVQWDATNEQGKRVASGVYFYRIQVQTAGRTFEQQRKMLLIK